MSNIIIIGTSHIAKESIKKVRQAIEEKKPDIVAVELDIKRYYGLMQPVKKTRLSFYNIKRIGFKGFLFAIIGSYISKKLGRMVGVEPGEEMMTAIKAAKKKKIKIALIDQDIEVTLARFSRYFSWQERWRVIADIFNGIFFKKREAQKYGIESIDLNKVPSDVMIEKLIGIMKLRYPSIYQVLVHERNVFMAEKLRNIMEQHPEKTVLAVVGAGHVQGITELLNMPSYSFSFDYSGQEDQTANIVDNF